MIGSREIEARLEASFVGLLRERGEEFWRLFVTRLRDRRFWAVQGLVFAITFVHGLLEVTGLLGEHQAVAFVPVTFYFIPVVYAGLNFGTEGAIPTALFVAALAAPNILLWHDGVERVGEFVQLTVMIGVAVVVARRVDEETRAKWRAQQVSARLAQLNATASAVGRSLDPSRMVNEVVGAMLDNQRLHMVWIGLLPEEASEVKIIARAQGGESTAALPWLEEEGTKQVIATGRPWSDAATPQGAPGIRRVALPIHSSERVIGVLGATCHDEPLSSDDMSVLNAVTRELGVAFDNIRHYQKAQEALADLTRAQENLRAYLRMATEAQEDERRRLARELHDDTIQSLLTIRASLDNLSCAASEHCPLPDASTRIASLKGLIESAVADVRRFARDLRPSLLDDLGLVHAIDALVNDISARTDIRADFYVRGASGRLPTDIELAAYRILQEALRNVERHSGATQVSVTLSFDTRRFTAVVEDNGCGFSLDSIANRSARSSGLGIVGMRERAKLAGGELNIESDLEHGTTLRLLLQV